MAGCGCVGMFPSFPRLDAVLYRTTGRRYYTHKYAAVYFPAPAGRWLSPLSLPWSFPRHGHFRWMYLGLSRPSVRHAWLLAFTLAKHLLHSYIRVLADPQQCSSVTMAHLVFSSCHRHLGGGGGSLWSLQMKPSRPFQLARYLSYFHISYFGRFLTLLLFTGQNKIKIVCC